MIIFYIILQKIEEMGEMMQHFSLFKMICNIYWFDLKFLNSIFRLYQGTLTNATAEKFDSISPWRKKNKQFYNLMYMELHH